MANTLGSLVAPLYEALNSVSREFVGFIPGVQRDNGNFTRAAVGQKVTVPIVPPIVGADIVPGVTPPNDGDQIFGNVDLTITKSRAFPIKWNGEEQLALENSGAMLPPILRMQFQQAFRAAVNEVEQDLALIAYRNASRAAGTPGTAPFGTAGDLSDFAQAAKVLDENGAPAAPRSMVVSSDSMANLRGKQSVLFKVNEAGTDETLRRGKVGEVQGFQIGYSPGIKQVVKGTGSGYVLGAGSYPVGTRSLTLATGSGTINPGDAITLAGDSNRYVVASGISAPGTVVIQSPGLKQAHVANDTVTVGASFTPNIAFTSDGLVLATRAPALPKRLDGTYGDGGVHQLIIDEFSGIAFDVGVYDMYRQVRFEVALAWGVAAPNPEHIALLMG